MNRLQSLSGAGQSPWYDNISSKLISSGELEMLLREDGLRGITTNPTIFEKAIAGTNEYDAKLQKLVDAGVTQPQALFEGLALDDIRRAADLLFNVYRQTTAVDGYVSLEVNPDLAHDTEGTIEEARRLFELAARPNVMIKVPATKAGLPAITTLIGSGIPVNVTLIFSVERYKEVAEAYLKGIEKLAAAKKRLAPVASVASFFVSRIDSAIDPKLPEEERGKVAIANAVVAYQAFREIFTSKRFTPLKDKGAQVQRPLWASTGTKDPKYSDVLYVEALIGQDTVNTMPPATWSAFRDHGKAETAIERNVAEAKATLAGLAKHGVDLAKVTAELEDAGVKSFSESYASLLRVIAEKTSRFRPAPASV